MDYSAIISEFVEIKKESQKRILQNLKDNKSKLNFILQTMHIDINNDERKIGRESEKYQDICSNLENPNTRTKWRYIEWFNEYVKIVGYYMKY